MGCNIVNKSIEKLEDIKIIDNFFNYAKVNKSKRKKMEYFCQFEIQEAQDLVRSMSGLMQFTCELQDFISTYLREMNDYIEIKHLKMETFLSSTNEKSKYVQSILDKVVRGVINTEKKDHFQKGIFQKWKNIHEEIYALLKPKINKKQEILKLNGFNIPKDLEFLTKNNFTSEKQSIISNINRD